MPSSWDDKIASPKRILDLLEGLKKRGSKEPRLLYSAPVHPELTLNWVLQNKSAVLKELKRAASDPHYRLDIVKHSRVTLDKQRDFYIAAWPERLLLMNMAKILTEATAPIISDSVYSFRAGRGTHLALSKLSEFLKKEYSEGKRQFFIVKRDVTKYGDSIPHDKLLHLLTTKTEIASNPIFMNLMMQTLRCVYRSASGAESCMTRGVPSGSPLVPPLENFYLSPLDDCMRKCKDAFYGRYGDDFLFVTSDLDTARAAIAFIDETVPMMGLTIKPEKREDLLISDHASPEVLKADGFKSIPAVEWLGAKIDARGRRSLKAKHRLEMWTILKSEIAKAVYTAQRMSTIPAVRKSILTARLKNLIAKEEGNITAALLYGHANEQSLKEFDEQVTHHIVMSLRKCWKLKKKEAWTLFRELSLPSAFYVQYMKIKQQRKPPSLWKGIQPKNISSEVLAGGSHERSPKAS
jgi:hypothetical protein